MFGIDDVALAVVGSALVSAGSNYLATKGANDSNVGLWREQAEYNKPINQLARLKEAGLNPNLIYGSGALQNTITSAPKMEAPRFDLDLLSAYQQVKNGQAQRALLNEQRNLVKQEQNNAMLKGIGMTYENVFKELENIYKAHEVQYFLDKGSVKGANVFDSLFDRILSFMKKYPDVNPMDLLFKVLGTAKGWSDIDYNAIQYKDDKGNGKGFSMPVRRAIDFALYND